MNVNRRRLATPRTAIGVFTTCILLATSTQSAEFIPLGYFPNGSDSSHATAVSDDGTVVVGLGKIADEVTEAFRWTEETGMVALGDFPGGFHRSRAWGVSADGTVVVGHGSIDGSIEAFRWTASDGMVGLGGLLEDIIESGAEGISA